MVLLSTFLAPVIFVTGNNTHDTGERSITYPTKQREAGKIIDSKVFTVDM